MRIHVSDSQFHTKLFHARPLHFRLDIQKFFTRDGTVTVWQLRIFLSVAIACVLIVTANNVWGSSLFSSLD